MAENFPNLAKGTKEQILEIKKTPNRVRQKKSMSRHAIIKPLKTKDKGKILKAN